MSTEEFDADLYKAIGEEPIELNDDLNNIIVVDNLPVCGEDKYKKLLSVLAAVNPKARFFGRFGTIVDVYMPLVEGQTLGYAFIEYENAEQATAALQLNNKPLDKNHVMRVNKYTDFDKFNEVPDEYVVREQEYENKSNNLNFLLDEKNRDQYLVRHGNETEIYWNDPVAKRNENGRTLVNGGEDHKERGKTWTELWTSWSPKGTYLATFHQQGIVLWGGDKFEKLQRFLHPGVKLIDFSPCENYVVTCNAMEAKRPGDPECIIVWDVRTGRKLRGFTGGSSPTWPSFKWSHDDKYVARTGKDKAGNGIISVYQVPDMGLLDKKSIRVEGVREVAWSPSDNILSYWVPMVEDKPAKVSLISIPSREVVREKHLYNVADVKMHWHDKGYYFCVNMVRLKSKKTTSSNFEIFRLNTKNIPIDLLEIEDNIIAFAWEPNGHRFALIHENGPTRSVSFYQLKKKKIILQKTHSPVNANAIFWSPRGGQVLLAGLGSLNGQFEWYDAESFISLCNREHYMCTHVDWDPTGRYVLTSVCQPLMLAGAGSFKYTMDNGYKIWSYDSKGDTVWQCTTNQPLDRCFQVQWRPRPATLLTPKEQQDVEKGLREKFFKKYHEIDEKLKASQMGEEHQRRLKLKEDWKKYRARRAKEYAEEASVRAELRGGVLSDDEEDYTTVEETVEETVAGSEKTLPYDPNAE